MHLQKFQDERLRQDQVVAEVQLPEPRHRKALHIHVACLACGLNVCFFAYYCTMLQGLAESYADTAAAQAMLRQDLLASLHSTVQNRRDRTAQQVSTHQSLLDRQVRPFHC